MSSKTSVSSLLLSPVLSLTGAAEHRFCGMRRPSLVVQQNDVDGDLSRLAASPVDNIAYSSTPTTTTSSSSSGSSSSSTSSSCAVNGGNNRQQQPQSVEQSSLLRSQEPVCEDTAIETPSYLPKIIELEWQAPQAQQLNLNHRKRKERLDSTSSNSQTDRKVIRSNNNNNSNDEQLSGVGGGDVGQSVEAPFHSDALIGNGKHALPDGRAGVVVATKEEGEDGKTQQLKPLLEIIATTKETGVDNNRSANHCSSPLRSQSHHPHVLQHTLSSVGHHQYHHNSHKKNGVVGGGGNGNYSPIATTIPTAALISTTSGDDHYSDGEHERRRSSERFCRSRAPHGRKSSSCSSAKKSSSSSVTGGGGGGSRYMSRATALSIRNQNSKEERGGDEAGQAYKYDLSTLKTERRGFSSRDSQKHKKQREVVGREGEKLLEKEVKDSKQQEHQMEVMTDEQEVVAPLPWNEFPEELPVVCPRFAENTFDHVINVSDKFVKIHPPAKKENSIKYVNNENMKTRDIMKKYGSQKMVNNNINSSSWSRSKCGGDLRLMIITPDERVRQINGRLTKLKKRIVQYEEDYEKDNGKRPEAVDTLGDKAMKTIMTEMQKLKRERQVIKTCDVVSGSAGLVTPISGVSSSTAASMFGGLKEIAQESQLSGDMKINKMQETLTDIEMVLQERRKDDSRQEPLEKLSMEQLLHEKTAVQKGLLYLEGMYGRPNSKEERDLARPLYDRYRQIKRMLNRNSSMISASIDLPTILEHEAMVFTSTNNTPSTDATPPDSRMVAEDEAATEEKEQQEPLNDDSNSLNDNLHQLSISELWHQLDLVREEKKLLRRTIKEYEQQFEEESGRKMLKGDRKAMEETYALYKQKKGRLRLLDALVKKHMAY